MPVDSLRGVRVRVPAKINLHLSVGPVRTDGYHELITVFHAVDLLDELVARPAEGLSLSVVGVAPGSVPADERNLAWRAAVLLADTAGLAPRVRLELSKAIPVAGGMAGGSADAAAALLACARLWDLDVTAAELGVLAARLGSDVAFGLYGGTALGTGRGEVLAPLTTRPRLHWVLAMSAGGISAGAAYRELDRLRSSGSAPDPLGAPEKLVAALEDGTVETVAAHLGNDLQAAALALQPALAGTLAAGRRHGALAGLVSGSGPTVAFLCADAADAERIATALGADGVCHTTRTATGPVPGAQVVR